MKFFSNISRSKVISAIFAITVFLIFSGCNKKKKSDLSFLVLLGLNPSGPALSSDCPSGKCSVVNIGWTARPESGVNRPGGGYRVYYCSSSTSSGCSAFRNASSVLELSDYRNIDVPYVSGAKTPHTVSASLDRGMYYFFRVVGYSDINTTGGMPSDTVQRYL